MRLPRRFIKLPLSFDQARLVEEVSQFGEDEWRAHPQRFEGNSSLILVSTHGRENDDFWGPMQPASRLEKMPYVRQVMRSFNTVIGRSRLMRLAPGAKVDYHVDSHYFWRDHLRIHVPIITDPAVEFHCESEQVHMAAGEAWTFDNWRGHWVVNGSNKARIHLVIDTVGSSDVWQMIEGHNHAPRMVEFDPAADVELRFESYRGHPVVPTAELRADLEQLLDDLEDNKPQAPDQTAELRAHTRNFIRDWHSQWMAEGPTVAGFPGFKAVLETYRKTIDRVPANVVLGSNGHSFKEAVTSTLDEALSLRNFPDTDTAETSASAIPKRPRFDRPIFIVAAPRSGSTLLFETLAVNAELWTVGDESHKHFESIPALRPGEKNPSNRLTASQATRDTTETLLNSFVADLVNSAGRSFSDLPQVARPTEVRFLEKTPKNALRIPFIVEVFPDARFIFLFRDARQNISSLLDSWRSRRYVTYPGLPGWPAQQPWSHLLIPGWEQLTRSSLAEIVAQQWLVTNQTILDDLEAIPKERWCAVEYDSLLANPPAEIKRLCHESQIIFGPRMQEITAKPLAYSKYTLTPPHRDKWKKNAAEIEPVLPATEAMMSRLRSLVGDG